MLKQSFLTGTRFKTSETSPYQYEFERSFENNYGIIKEYNSQNRVVRTYNVMGLNNETCTISIPGIRTAHSEVLQFNKLLTINYQNSWQILSI